MKDKENSTSFMSLTLFTMKMNILKIENNIILIVRKSEYTYFYRTLLITSFLFSMFI